MHEDDQVTKIVHSVLEEIGVSRSSIAADVRLLNLIVDEDLTFWFIPDVEAKLGVRAPAADWEIVRTVGDAVQMLRRHVR